MQTIKRTSLYIFFGLLAYVPLHILLSTWIGSNFGILEEAKIAKDFVLVVGFLLACVSSSRSFFWSLLRKPVSVAILAYVGITVLLAAIMPTDPDAEVLGVVYNTRFLMIFLYAGLLGEYYQRFWLIKRSLQIVLGVAALVLVFGMTQYLVLSDSALGFFGYSRENGVLPTFSIDNKPGLERIMATLRDPNSYGSYLILIISSVIVLIGKTKNLELRKIYSGLLALGALNLLFTFSRSAWLGLVVALIALTATQFSKIPKRSLKLAAISSAMLVLIGSGLLFVLRDQYFVQNVVFHADESTVMEDPNQLRSRFWQESIDRTVKQPLGHGPGTAGLASIRNDEQVILNENYYLQIAHEVGVIGLGLFLAIIGLIFARLLKQKNDTLALVLVMSLVGLSFTNLLVHIWSNEAVAYTFWALAGLALLNKKPVKISR